MSISIEPVAGRLSGGAGVGATTFDFLWRLDRYRQQHGR